MDNSFESTNTATTDVSTLTKTVNADMVETKKQEILDKQFNTDEELRENQTNGKGR